MRSGSRYLLMALWVMGATLAHADETNGLATSAQPEPAVTSQINELQQRLHDSERQRQELIRQLQNTSADRESAQLSRLRQENQKLKLQLKESQSVEPQRMLTEQQQWFVAGGGVAMIALLCGIFASGWRRQRRQWLN